MTKLEEKLIELDYSQYDNITFKRIYNDYVLSINIYAYSISENEWWITIPEDEAYVDTCEIKYFFNQWEIDKLQQAFSQLKQDVKELKKYE